METQNYTRATLRVPTGKTFGPQAPKIDANAGVIYGCSVITQGPADGWPFVVDAKTLEQVQSLGEAAADGIQVKIDHGSGFENIVGVMRGFRIEGPKVIADLFLLKTHEKYLSILEIARTMPAAVGFSIAFALSMEEIEGVQYARVAELYSIDLVDDPAANPSGLFSAGLTELTGPRPDILQLAKLAEDFGIRDWVSMDEAALLAECEKAAFQKHLRFPGMTSDRTLAAKHWRPDSSRVKGLSRFSRAMAQRKIDALFSNKH